MSCDPLIETFMKVYSNANALRKLAQGRSYSHYKIVKLKLSLYQIR